MAFIHEDFLLQSRAARSLYARYAADQPILDYHCHLSPRDIAENRRFANLFEIWLEGDHQKWRAMRANGIAERFCTGNADPYDKFTAWASTVPLTLRNPLYHWTRTLKFLWEYDNPFCEHPTKFIASLEAASHHFLFPQSRSGRCPVSLSGHEHPEVLVIELR